ncbi:hypothetical protein MAMC_01007 [Methylacidimicrobium cyclopophantes]|uniref:Uncharacterized protein n=1 Tax=Methylacidimicrobium cyclopophantes TaxID=1041766 RepID=A0A5E6MD83_9BACT|nr:hypothetical protein MAMC_01007 [Methylacidimicrobium cyclopophantes]
MREFGGRTAARRQSAVEAALNHKDHRAFATAKGCLALLPKHIAGTGPQYSVPMALAPERADAAAISALLRPFHEPSSTLLSLLR